MTKASVPFREISRGDVSNGAYEAIIDLWVQERGLEPAEHRWRIHGPADELDLGAFQVKRLQPLVSHLDLLINDPLSSVPTIARYGVERRVNASLDSEPRDLDEETPRSLYADFLDATVLDYSGFFGWFRNREDLENELIREDRGYRDTPLSAVRSAISSLLPGFSRLRVRRASRLGVPDDFAHRKGPILLIDKGETTLSLDQLSHGEQGLIAMVGDIARRLAINNPTLENPLAGEGILLIDEIALHLHPRWQREVVPALERTFPSCQLILTTHSPQVIARVPRRDVRILEGGALLEDTPHTYGRSATAILSDLMDLPPHPEDIQRRLHEIAALIDKGDFDQARSRLDTLAESLGDQDAEIIRNRTLIEMLAE